MSMWQKGLPTLQFLKQNLHMEEVTLTMFDKMLQLERLCDCPFLCARTLYRKWSCLSDLLLLKKSYLLVMNIDACGEFTT